MAEKIEDSPEFKAALQEACEGQYRGWLYGGNYAKAHSKDTIASTMEEIQRQRQAIEEQVEGAKRHAEEARRDAETRMMMSQPFMQEITKNLARKYGVTQQGKVCPVCGEGDHGNRMNGKPVCFMNHKHKEKGVDGPVLLVSPEKVKDWKPPKKPKPRELTFKDIDVARVRK